MLKGRIKDFCKKENDGPAGIRTQDQLVSFILESDLFPKYGKSQLLYHAELQAQLIIFVFYRSKI